MTQKNMEQLLRDQLHQSLPDKDALWAKIEQNLGEQKTPAEKPAPAVRMHIAYRVMGVAACLLLVVGGVGIFSSLIRPNHNYETATMESPMNDAAVQENADEMAADADDDEMGAADADCAADAGADMDNAYGDDAAGDEMDADDADAAPEPEKYANSAAGSPKRDSMQSPAAPAEAARSWLTQNAPDVIPTITNWDSPEVTQVGALPAAYASVADGYTPAAPYWCVHFTTTQDALLGTENVYVDANGVVCALSLRE